ncbi:unnamed protein product [Vicia faba]|uniref:Transmembrane protein n=1 Tax=Vicia faba TaxID=3906 RepID=A0AAV1AAA0_VICFA|nr:unnamed protein product [Vicia faba]
MNDAAKFFISLTRSDGAATQPFFSDRTSTSSVEAPLTSVTFRSHLSCDSGFSATLNRSVKHVGLLAMIRKMKKRKPNRSFHRYEIAHAFLLVLVLSFLSSASNSAILRFCACVVEGRR